MKLLSVVVALGLTIGLSFTNAQAVSTIFTDKTAFMAATGALNLENFNSQSDGAEFHTVGLDIGAFTMSMTGTPRTDSGRNEIDAPPPQFAVFNVDGTTLANVLTTSGASLLLTFDTAITAFGVDLASFNDSSLRTSIHAAGTSTTPAIGGSTFVRFYGITSDTAFTTVEFRGITGDGFGLDNVRYGGTTAAVPEPSTMLLFGSGILGLAAWRRFKKTE